MVATQSARTSRSGGSTSSGEKVITIDMDKDPAGADAFFRSMTGRSKRKR